jgi:hypothetical protein
VHYFKGIRQTRSQYENAIKLSMNRSDNKCNTLDSTCWFSTPLQEQPPQESQYRSSPFVTVRHSRHCFRISRIMP